MEVGVSLRLAVTEPSMVGEARRQVTRLAEGLGMGELEAARVALVTTELAGNLVKHTPQGGELLVRPLEREGIAGVEVLAVDRGPGITDVGQALQDGYSTAGSPGTGLGAVGRQADLFQLHSLPGAGTALLAHVWARPLPETARAGVWVGVVCVPKPGQTECGDRWATARQGQVTTAMVVDGLGHGAGAAQASAGAVAAFQAHADRPPEEVLHAAHRAMRGTRGAAVSVARLDQAQGEIRFAGVGNVAGAVLTGGQWRSLVSHNGIVGHEMRRVQEFSATWERDALLVLHSDGLGSRWSLDRYPALVGRHPSLIAAVLYRDFARGTDDVTVLVARELTA